MTRFIFGSFILGLIAGIFGVFDVSGNTFVSLRGTVKDQATRTPLPYATIFLEEEKRTLVADSVGKFEIANLKSNQGYHFKVQHIGCETLRIFLSIKSDTTVFWYLTHRSFELNEAVIHGLEERQTAQVSNTISRNKLLQQGHKSLADVLVSSLGVRSLKNGTHLAKPLINGLWGNRISLLNHGVLQAGQLWGNDHAPEIDPFSADHITVFKGLGAVEYGDNTMGGVVLIEPKRITNDPHQHYSLNYILETNGWGNTLNFRTEKNDKWLKWLINATLKRSGDTKSPSYFLTNTGREETSISLQLEKDIKRWKNRFYYSLFNTEIGILSASHLGNLTDLERAIEAPKPFQTKDHFSYKIEPPKQQVTHHLLKLESDFEIDNYRKLYFLFSGQVNRRKEFDRRRGGRDNIPVLDLMQIQLSHKMSYWQKFMSGIVLKSGAEIRFVDNENVHGTGVNPLIPNYKLFVLSGFSRIQKKWGIAFWELGGRYSFRNLSVQKISNTLPRKVIKKSNPFEGYSVFGGMRLKPKKNFTLSINLGQQERPPEVNELYSYGLHQGVSGIEEGNENLRPETAWKTNLSLSWSFRKKFFFLSETFYQKIHDYMYLQPQNEFRLTIRGAFPVFIYEQTEAQIYGWDSKILYDINKYWSFGAKYSLLRGDNLTDNLPLIALPPDNLQTEITFKFFPKKWFSESFLKIENEYAWKQNRLEMEQDFKEPPSAYSLLDLSSGTNITLNKSVLKIEFSVENMLNTKYRDYMNRLRYFADERGINFQFKLGLSW